MTLELPSLDDRRFQDLVDEAKRLIPQYCPEWTNHNVGDPGVALIELFAYMTEITLFKVNQLPDRLYTLLLDLIGAQLRAGTAAATELRFTFAALTTKAGENELVVPKGAEVATTPAADGTETKFAVTEPVRVVAADLRAFLVGTIVGGDALVDEIGKLSTTTEQSVECFAQLQRGASFYLGFGSSMARSIIRLEVNADAEGTGIDPNRPPIEWQAMSDGVWQTCRQIGTDTTGGLNQPGEILIQLPSRHESATVGSSPGHWLRAVLTRGLDEAGSYRRSPRLTSLVVHTVGAAVPARHAETVHGPTFLGHSDGTPGQHFELAPNVQPRDDDQFVRVIAPGSTAGNGAEQRWTEVHDFGRSGPRDRHVTWDEVNGGIRFGPSIRGTDGRPQQHGMIPERGAEVWVSGYVSGVGRSGNVGAHRLVHLHQSLRRVVRVENPTTATGGTDPETLDDLKASGAPLLRAGARAVTGTDYEELTRRSAESVARVICARPLEPGGPLRLLVLPAGDFEPSVAHIDELAITDEIVEEVRRVLDPVRMIGTEIEITTPYYQGVSIVAEVRPRLDAATTAIRSNDELRRAIEAELHRYLDPLRGGPDGTGWPISTDLVRREVIDVIDGVPGVGRVVDVALFDVDLRGGEDGVPRRVGPALTSVRLDPDSLFLSFQHRVVVDEVPDERVEEPDDDTR